MAKEPVNSMSWLVRLLRWQWSSKSFIISPLRSCPFSTLRQMWILNTTTPNSWSTNKQEVTSSIFSPWHKIAFRNTHRKSCSHLRKRRRGPSRTYLTNLRMSSIHNPMILGTSHKILPQFPSIKGSVLWNKDLALTPNHGA